MKEVTVGGARYVVCRNEAEAEKDRADRRAVVDGLQRRLAGGEKALIGNSAYRRGQGVRDRRRQACRGGPLRRHLRSAHQRRHDLAQRRAPLPGAAHGGRPVPPGEGPVGHPTDLPLLRRGDLRPCLLILPRAGPPEGTGRPLPHSRVSVEWDDLIRDLDRLQESTIEKDGKRITTRTHVEGQVGKVFQAVGIALPPNWREPTA